MTLKFNRVDDAESRRLRDKEKKINDANFVAISNRT